MLRTAHWGGGVDGAIHIKGGSSILAECVEIRKTIPKGLTAGEVVITDAGKLKTKKSDACRRSYMTRWRFWGTRTLEKGLFQFSDRCKKEWDNAPVVPSISADAFGHPIRLAAKVAVSAIIDFIRSEDSIDAIAIVLFHEKDLIGYADAVKETLRN